MQNQKIVKMLHEQINKELFSAYLYLSIANHYSQAGLAGFENWYYIQTQEERDHAMLIRRYLLNSGEAVAFAPIEGPDKPYPNHVAPMEAALAHEEFITASIHAIYSAAFEIKDFRTMQFLDWFVKEQAEEEKNANELIQKYELFGKDGKGLYMLDRELAARVYAPPSLVL